MAYRALLVLALFLGLLAVRSASAATPASETLLPATTKGYLAIPDVDELRRKFNETQLGQLFQDPAMKEFGDDLQKQIRERMSARGVALTWDDLEGVYGGEVAIAAIQPGGDKKLQASALLCDVTGKRPQAQELLVKIDKNLVAKKAVRSAEKFGETTIYIYTQPLAAGERVAKISAYAIAGDLFVATDHLETMREILGRAAGKETPTLASVPGYVGVMKNVAANAGQTPTHLRWWIEPLGYAEVKRVAAGKKRTKEDLVKVLRNQGFDALQGVGGIVAFSTGGHEITHHTFAFAPKDPQATGQDKYRLAARMLDFPNLDQQEPEFFAPRELATYLTFNWRMKTAFDYLGSLVDEFADEEGLFEDILKSLEEDPNGPRINVRKDLVAHLGGRVSLLTDYVLPITPKSERIAAVIEVTDAAAIEKTVEKEMKANNQARQVKLPGGQIIWEIVKEEATDIQGLEIAGPGDELVLGGEEEEEEEAMLPNSAVTVIRTNDGGAGGWLVVGSHVDFLAKLHEQRPTEAHLSAAADRDLVNKALNAMKRTGMIPESFRFFSRTDENVRPTYELIRAGQMPQAETMLARVLNRMLGDSDPKKGPRKQLIDGGKLPEFEVVRRYLGPAGAYVHSSEEGWLINGCVLTKDAGPIVVADKPAEAPAPEVKKE